MVIAAIVPQEAHCCGFLAGFTMPREQNKNFATLNGSLAPEMNVEDWVLG